MKSFVIKNGIGINTDNHIFDAVAEKLCEYLRLFFGAESFVSSDSGAEISFKLCECEAEHFTLEIKEEKIKIFASEIKGATYAVSTLIELANPETAELPISVVTDGPYKEFRGIHMYLPARENIPFFKRVLELLTFFKMNTVILEVGGAMEYEKHPEINKTWEWFCNVADNVFPGEDKSRSLQWSDIYWKDSVHTELGGGSYLTKDEVRDIVGFAKKQGLSVVPELQALSHSYYMTLAHREIAELEDDMFPDSYCPLNEKSYELYFELAEEVIEVFQPAAVSIGHDEIRVLGQCPRCREKTGHELLSYEINRLYEFYSRHGIRIMMWADKLLNFVSHDGKQIGLGVDKINDYGFRYYMPDTHDAADTIPKDILMLNWYYSLACDTEDGYTKKGFNSVFGNFAGSCFSNWDVRSAKKGVLGAEISTWCVTDEKTFARDGVLFEILFSSHILWDKNYAGYKRVCEKAIKKSALAKILVGRAKTPLREGGRAELLYAGEKDASVATLNLAKMKTADNRIAVAAKELGECAFGVPIDTTGVLIKREITADSLLFVHSTKKDMRFLPSYLFPSEDEWGLGTYEILFEDGTLELANAVFGRTVGPLDFELKSKHGENSRQGFEIDEVAEGDSAQVHNAPTFEPKCAWMRSLCYSVVPMLDGENAAFAFEWVNPHPDKKITKIKAINTCRDKTQSVVLFGVLGIRTEAEKTKHKF